MLSGCVPEEFPQHERVHQTQVSSAAGFISCINCKRGLKVLRSDSAWNTDGSVVQGPESCPGITWWLYEDPRIRRSCCDLLARPLRKTSCGTFAELIPVGNRARASESLE